MLAALALLPLTAVVIQDVHAESSPSAVTIDVATSEPVDGSDVRGTVASARRIWVYVQGSSAARRTFGSEAQPIVVYPRARYTKLEIPTQTRCSEPMAVEATASGIRVRATCGDDAGAGVATALPVRPHAAEAGKPFPEAPLAAKTKSRTDAESLRAALALPTEAAGGEGDAADETSGKRAEKTKPDGKAESKASLPAKTAAPTEVENKAVPAAANNAVTAKAQPDAPVAVPGLVESSDSSGTAHDNAPKASSTSTSGSLTTLLAVALLAGLAVAAVVLARRRTTRTRMIKIVETASIGPRRSLVVANVAGRTMVLGVSEAGVALLDAALPAAPEEAKAHVESRASQITPSMEESLAGLIALADERSAAAVVPAATPEAKHESSLLSRLFRRPTPSSRGFEDLLSESVEDQELRRKLSLGESGRVA